MIRTAFSGFLLTQCLYVAAKLDIADILDDQKKIHVDALAKATNTDSQSLNRILTCLARYGIFEEHGAGTFSLNEQAKLLQDSNLKGYIIFSGEEAYQAASQLLNCVKTGTPGFPKLYGMTHWEYLSKNPEKADAFHRGMVKDAAQIVQMLQENYNLLPYQKIIDVGGGSGHIVGGILQKYSDKEGIVFDLESVQPLALEKINQMGLSNRLQFECGSFFEEIPKDGDLYLMKVILHDWDDEHAKMILANCANAMHRNSRLLIIDRLMDNPQHKLNTAYIDILMMCMLGGRERTVEEFKELCDASGLQVLNVYAQNQPLNILEVAKT